MITHIYAYIMSCTVTKDGREKNAGKNKQCANHSEKGGCCPRKTTSLDGRITRSSSPLCHLRCHMSNPLSHQHSMASMDSHLSCLISMKGKRKECGMLASYHLLFWFDQKNHVILVHLILASIISPTQRVFFPIFGEF